MRRFLYILKLSVYLPVDTFRFTTDAWRYTFKWIYRQLFFDSQEFRCPFCIDLDVGHVPRRISPVIKYKNIWLLKLLQPEIVVTKYPDRPRPRLACMNEGGYIKIRWYIPFLAVILGAAWNGFFIWALWELNVIPDAVKLAFLAYFSA